MYKNTVVITCTSTGAVVIIFLIFQFLRLQTMLHMEGSVQPLSVKGLKITCGPRNVVSRLGREARGGRRREKRTSPGGIGLRSPRAGVE